MNSNHTARALDRASTTHHLAGRGRSRRLAVVIQALLVAIAAASLIACGGSDEDEQTPPSAWDEMNWDEGVWE